MSLILAIAQAVLLGIVAFHVRANLRAMREIQKYSQKTDSRMSQVIHEMERQSVHLARLEARIDAKREALAKTEAELGLS